MRKDPDNVTTDSPLDRLRAEVLRVRESALNAHDQTVSETLNWVLSLIDRERNKALAK